MCEKEQMSGQQIQASTAGALKVVSGSGAAALTDGWWSGTTVLIGVISSTGFALRGPAVLSPATDRSVTYRPQVQGSERDPETGLQLRRQGGASEPAGRRGHRRLPVA